MRRWSWLSAVVGLVVGGSAVGIGWGAYAGQVAADAAFRECMAGYGYALGLEPDSLEGAVAASEACR